jgi:Flp pilus assembly protein TadB
MPLDDAERSVLAETERSLAADDPSFARRWHRASGSGGRRSRAYLAVAVVGLLLIVGLFWLGLPGQALLILLLTIGVLLGVGWRPRLPQALRDELTPPGPRTPDPGP